MCFFLRCCEIEAPLPLLSCLTKLCPRLGTLPQGFGAHCRMPAGPPPDLPCPALPRAQTRRTRSAPPGWACGRPWWLTRSSPSTTSSGTRGCSATCATGRSGTGAAGAARRVRKGRWRGQDGEGGAINCLPARCTACHLMWFELSNRVKTSVCSSCPPPCCSGDCQLGVNEATCTPRLAHWKESAATVAALAGGQPIDLKGMECSRPAADIDINTTMAGKRQAVQAACAPLLLFHAHSLPSRHASAAT